MCPDSDFDHDLLDVLVQVLELATGLGVFSQRIMKESESVFSVQVVLGR